MDIMDKMQMKDNVFESGTDQELLDRFFAEARMPMADEGFTARVMQQIQALELADESGRKVSALSLARWNLWLNLSALVAGIIWLIYAGVFGRIGQVIQIVFYRIIAGVVSFDLDDFLVQTMLFLHRLHDTLPPFTHIVTLGLTIFFLMVLGVHRLAKMEEFD